MSRALLALLALALAPPVAHAQGLFADPTVWASVNAGIMTWTPGPYSPSTDQLSQGLSLHIATTSWAAHAGYVESDRLKLTLSPGSFNFYSRLGLAAAASGAPVYGEPEVEPYETLTYRALYAAVGPQWQGHRLFGAVAVGPAVGWGTRARDESRVCVSDCPWSGFTDYDRRFDDYHTVGLAGRVEGGFRLLGRVWLGGETTVFLGQTGTHAATGVNVRVDLLRPDR